MLKNAFLILAVLVFSVVAFGGAAHADDAQAKYHAVVSKPLQGNIEVWLPDRWKMKESEERPTFWWATFTDSEWVAEPFISWGKNFGRRDLPLEEWGNAFIKRRLVAFSRNRPYTVESSGKKPAVLGSGQEVEFSTYRIRIDGQIILDAAFTFLASRDGTERVRIGIFQSGTVGDVYATIPVIAQAVFFKD